MTIDPFEQKPVYEEEQVITPTDLQHLFLAYQLAEQEMRNQGQDKQGMICCISHNVIEAIMIWLEDGKPSLFDKEIS